MKRLLINAGSTNVMSRLKHGRGYLRLILTLLVIPVIALAIAARTSAADGLIGGWQLDEGSGTTATDSSGNGIHGTIVRGTGTGSPAWVSPGHDVSTPFALDFDGTGTVGSASNTVNLGNDARLNQLDNYTISMWVKFKPGYVGGGGPWANLIGRTAPNTDWAWMIYVSNSGTIRPHHRNSNGSFVLTDSATVMPVDEWVHIEQVADGNQLHLYINGQEDPNFPISYSGTTMSLPTGNVYIGQDTRERAPLATISDVKIYDDATLAPQVITSAATNIMHSSARLNGSLSTLGDYTSAEVFFRYRLAGSSDPYTETMPQTVNAAGQFNANISGLAGNTQYEFVAVAKWQGRDGTQETEGALLNFTTPAYGVHVQVVDNLTGEDGDTGSFKVCLSAMPSAPVTVALSSSNINEGTVPASITIQPADWNNCDANIVTVTGVNDAPPVGDGAVPYTVVTGDVTSADPNFNALAGSDVVDVSMTNQNDDPPGVAVTIVDNSTSEGGGTARVRFELLSAPSADVTIPLTISDGSEGTLGVVTNVTITPGNWNQPANNEIVISGLDDALTDGDILYQLITGDPVSGDAGYNALTDSDIANVALTNVDNDTAGVTVSETGGSTAVTEGGATDSFSVVLNTQPAPGNSVIVTVQPDTQVNLGNGAGVAVQLTFNNSNWNVPQSVTVVATDDTAIEGAHTGLITTSIDPSTTELSYIPVDPADVTAQIADNDDDNDGVVPAVEDACPNGGDVNEDSLQDSRQPNVVCFESPITGNYVALEIDDACQLNSQGVNAEADQTNDDPNFEYPYGLMNYTADCGTPGYTTDVTMYFFGASGNLVLRKHNPNDGSYFNITGANIETFSVGGASGLKGRFQIADGGALDMDGTSNGQIVDPAGFALQKSGPGSGLAGTGQSTWYYVLLATLLIVASVESIFGYRKGSL